MTRPPREAIAHKLVVGVSLLAAAITVASALRGFPDLATHVRDDAFHEFAWARNLAAGNGPSVGAGIPTSGVQPLWSLLLVVAAWWTDRLESVAPILGILCHCAAAWLLRREGRGTWIGTAAALLWLGNPLLLRECQNGQETALACLCGVVLWKARRGGVAPFALASAVATLARADLFLLALLLASTRRADRVFLRVSTVVFALLPWLVFQRACGGSWLPDSAAPMAWLARENFALLSPTTAEWWSQQWRFTRPALLGGPFRDASVAGFGALIAVAAPPLGSAAARFAPIAACAAAAAFGAEDLGTPLVASLLLASAPSNRASSGRARLQFLALAFALVGIVVVHDALRWHPRDYYFAPLALAGAVGLIALRRRPFAALLVASAQLAQAAWMPLPLEPLAHQRGMQAMGAALAPLLGDGVVVGCFNSGIVSWEQLRHGDRGARVVNLDGVVNAAAFTALRNARLSDYLDREGARFLCDHPAQWSMDVAVPHANGPWFDGGRAPGQGLVEIARCVVPGQVAHRPGTEAFVLCWRRGRGEPPRLPERTQWLARTSDGAGVVWFCAKAGDILDLGEGAREPWFTADRDGNYLVPAPRGARIVRMRGRDESIPGGVLR